MARQKSEDRVLPQGGVMPAERAGSSPGAQGKAIPVEQTARQLRLPIATAEHPKGAARRAPTDRSVDREVRVPEAIVNVENVTPVTMEEVVSRLTAALVKVVSNKGAPGPDGQTVEALREQWPIAGPRLAASLLEGFYRPGAIRRANIPKAGGGMRGLGIPNVTDRVVCEAVRQVLEPVFEPTFHPSSHGFRPGRSCHTAIEQAKQHLEDGHGWVVDIDLEKFFDRVCHQRLMSRLAQRVSDRRLLVLIGRLLRAKIVLPDGVVIGNEEGVPQGSPLSPLLSNVVLDELDWELDRRGHRFVRYADLCGCPHRSAYAERRVMPSGGWDRPWLLGLAAESSA
jgi:RNA-directed DNA polymerase